MSVREEVGQFDAQRVRGAGGLLAAFNEAGVLAAADIHVALRLGVLAGETRDDLLLAAALAVRAPRLGSVLVDLATISSTAAPEVEAPVDVASLPWPDVGDWTAAVAASPLVAVGEEGGGDRPLRLVETTLYLDRYWRDEVAVAAALRARRDRGKLTVIVGGPGTGKTTIIPERVLRLDDEAAAAGRRAPLVALAAPTGKAAARLQEVVHERAAALEHSSPARARLLDLRAVTLHRLLGSRPDSATRFRHHRANQLPHDVVIVDETSMVSLSLMARLLEAVREDARLILVGDPEQLASVEAGAVLGDIVAGSRGDDVEVLREGYRFTGRIATLAEAVRSGDADAAIEQLGAGGDEIRWIAADVADPAGRGALAELRDAAVSAGRRTIAAAREGDGRGALDALGAFRILCAHRRGPYGAAAWNDAVAGWLGRGVATTAAGTWYVGRPLLVTANDYSLRLYNGDTGVVIARSDGRLLAVFERQGEPVEIAPARLASAETVYAMTIHRSQGSQADAVAVVLPDAASPILTRQLLYTAITRARERLLVYGTEAAVRAALGRRAARASGLARRLGD